jgi:hypothetical protein
MYSKNQDRNSWEAKDLSNDSHSSVILERIRRDGGKGFQTPP